MEVIFKFWETEARKDHTIPNTLMLKDALNEDGCNEGRLLLVASSSLSQSTGQETNGNPTQPIDGIISLFGMH
jgi:hypothetical protein